VSSGLFKAENEINRVACRKPVAPVVGGVLGKTRVSTSLSLCHEASPLLKNNDPIRFNSIQLTHLPVFFPFYSLSGWTSRSSVNFMVPIFGSSIYLPGLFLLFQSMLTYLPKSYKKCEASVLASNDLFRSTIASVAPLFGTAFFRTLGIGPGSSLLAGLSILAIPFLYLLKKHGAKLRARSKYASS